MFEVFGFFRRRESCSVSACPRQAETPLSAGIQKNESMNFQTRPVYVQILSLFLFFPCNYLQGFESFRFIPCKNFSLESGKIEVISNA